MGGINFFKREPEGKMGGLRKLQKPYLPQGIRIVADISRKNFCPD
jgi:hypothetical protein